MFYCHGFNNTKKQNPSLKSLKTKLKLTEIRIHIKFHLGDSIGFKKLLLISNWTSDDYNKVAFKVLN